jgi:hypothetical protein
MTKDLKISRDCKVTKKRKIVFEGKTHKIKGNITK